MIKNVQVYGFDESIKASKYPMCTDTDAVTSEVTSTTRKLASCPIGTGHDVSLNGIVVQFDLTFSNKAWVELQRYHYIDFVSSQSSMHCITKFDIAKQCNKYVDEKIIDILQDYVDEYNYISNIDKLKETVSGSSPKDKIVFKGNRISFFADQLADDIAWKEKVPTRYNDYVKGLYLKILYNIPSGFQLTARLTTNYRQLKTIYHQRKTHRLPEWREFCAWCETLPRFNELCLGETN